MTNELAEVLGLCVLVIGLGLVVAAAAMVSIPLATLVAGVLLTLVGVVVAYAANGHARGARVDR